MTQQKQVKLSNTTIVLFSDRKNTFFHSSSSSGDSYTSSVKSRRTQDATTRSSSSYENKSNNEIGLHCIGGLHWVVPYQCLVETHCFIYLQFQIENFEIVLTFTCSRSCGLLRNCSMNFNLVLIKFSRRFIQASRVSVFSIGSTVLWDRK